MTDLYAERVEAELELIEVASLYFVVWFLVDVAQRAGPTYIVINRSVVQDVAGDTLTCDLCVRCVHIFYLSVCIYGERKFRKEIFIYLQ